MTMTTQHNFLLKRFKTSSFIVIAAILLAYQGTISAQTNVDETKFKPVSAPFNVSTGDKIEVAELFWFGCGHCFALEPHLNKWLDNGIPKNAEFVKIPAIFSKRWEFHAQAFYTMEALGVDKKVYDAFFRSIHVERKPINNLNSLVEFMARYEKSEEEVEAAFKILCG